MQKLVLLGSGGHSKVIRDIVIASGNYEIIGLLDDKFSLNVIQANLYYGNIRYVHEILEKESNAQFIVAIGNNQIREKIVNQLMIPVHKYATIIHPTAIIGTNVTIGVGTVIMPNVVINADSEIGDHCILNTSSVIEHDNFISSFAHVSPNATLAGGVYVGEGTHIGIGSSIIPQKSVGDWSTVGAGAVVIEDIPSNCTAVGIPAKPIKFEQ